MQWREMEEPEQNKAGWMFLVRRGRIEARRTPLMHRDRTMMPKKNVKAEVLCKKSAPGRK
jgi:hypothetical protein